MITKELRMAATEINCIFRYMDEEEVRKVPNGLRVFFKEIANNKYFPIINPEISLTEQQLLNETDQILGMLYFNYWCTDEERENLSKTVKEKAEKASENIFQNKTPDELYEEINEQRNENLENTSIAKYGLPWYKRIFAWFKK